jgi:hypothetical protein
MQCLIIIVRGSLTAPNNTASVFQRFNVCCGNEVPVLSIAVAPLKRVFKINSWSNTYSVQRFLCFKITWTNAVT